MKPENLGVTRLSDMPPFGGGVSVFFQGKSISIRIIPTYPVQKKYKYLHDTLFRYLLPVHTNKN